MDTAALTGSSVAKRLASCNKTTRDRALRLLNTWLSAQTSAAAAAVSDEDLLKIWKGLFYCVWHADKFPVQSDLINRLSSLLLSVDLPLAPRYLEAFVATIRREWSGIDHLRMDKFYLLIRRFVYHLFLLLSKHSWDLDVSARMVGVLSEKSLLVVDKFPAQGVSYHIAEVFLDEIREFLPISQETLDALVKPFITVLERSSDKVLVSKIKSNIFDRLLENGAKYLDLVRAVGVEPGSDVEKFGQFALALNFSKKIFNSASSADTVQGNRKVLFGLHEAFLKIEKELEKSGMSISFSQANGCSTEAATSVASETTEQVVVNMASANGGSDDRSSKKRKKNKKTSSGGGKKSKGKKNGLTDSAPKNTIGGSISKEDNLSDISASIDDRENSKEESKENGDAISFDEAVISNLQKQFEKVAAEAGLTINGTGVSATPVTSTMAKKRKRVKSTGGQVSSSPSRALGGSATGKSGEKSTKKVRFSMKNNLVWKPHSPLPPQSLRLPPSATPRGSALKKGVPAGPIRETPPSTKKIKVKANSVKKVRKNSKSISPAVKRLRKLQSLSM